MPMSTLARQACTGTGKAGPASYNSGAGPFNANGFVGLGGQPAWGASSFSIRDQVRRPM